MYRDPYWNAYAKYALGPANNGYYKDFPQGSPGMLSPMFIHNNETSHTAMVFGNNYSIPYNPGVKNFAHLPPDVMNLGFLNKQVKQCTFDSYQPTGCERGAVVQVLKTVSDHPQKYFSWARDHMKHPHNISYETGAHEDMWIVPHSGDGNYP